MAKVNRTAKAAFLRWKVSLCCIVWSKANPLSCPSRCGHLVYIVGVDILPCPGFTMYLTGVLAFTLYYRLQDNHSWFSIEVEHCCRFYRMTVEVGTVAWAIQHDRGENARLSGNTSGISSFSDKNCKKYPGIAFWLTVEMRPRGEISVCAWYGNIFYKFNAIECEICIISLMCGCGC